MTKRLLKIISYILVLLSFVFIFKAISAIDIKNLSAYVSISSFFFILFSAVLYSLNSPLFALAWRKLLQVVSGRSVPLRLVLNLYFRSNIAKYLPGNVFHFAGRHLLVNERIVGHRYMLFANILEIGLLIISACLVVVAGVMSGLVHIPDRVFSLIQLRFVITGMVLAMGFSIMAALYLYKHKKLDLIIHLLHILKPEKLIQIFYAGLLYSIMFITTGFILYLILFFTTPGVFSLSGLMQVIFIFTLAWVAGYIVPGAPGGVGIREAILIIMLAVSFETSAIAMASIILRFITIAGDILTYIYSKLPALKYTISEEAK